MPKNLYTRREFIRLNSLAGATAVSSAGAVLCLLAGHNHRPRLPHSRMRPDIAT